MCVVELTRPAFFMNESCLVSTRSWLIVGIPYVLNHSQQSPTRFVVKLTEKVQTAEPFRQSMEIPSQEHSVGCPRRHRHSYS
jgi:hypothetical protein